MQRQRKSPRYLDLEDVARDDVVERATHPILELVPREIGLVVVGGDVDSEPRERRPRLAAPRPRSRCAELLDARDRARICRVQSGRFVAVHAAREQQSVLRVVEHRDGVEDARTTGAAVRVGHPPQRGAARIAPPPRRSGNRRRRREAVPPCPGADAAPATRRRARAPSSGSSPSPVSLITRDGPWPSIDQRATAPLPSTELEQEAARFGPDRPHRRDRRRLPHRQLENDRDDVVVSEAAPRLLEPGNRLVHRRRAMGVSSGHRGADVLRDPARRLLEVGDGCRVAQADVPGAARSE